MQFSGDKSVIICKNMRKLIAKARINLGFPGRHLGRLFNQSRLTGNKGTRELNSSTFLYLSHVKHDEIDLKCYSILNCTSRDFPGGPVVKNCPPLQGMQVRSLVRELRSHMPQGN